MKFGETEINTRCVVLKVLRREISMERGGKSVFLLGIIADDTAKLRFVSREEREELVKDTVVQIENVSVKRWKGLPILYIGKETKIRVIEESIDPERYAELIKPKKRSIGEIIRCGGAFDVSVEGNIVSITEGGDKNSRTLILDDGTGAVALVLREEREEAIETRIYFGIPVKVRGNVVNVEEGYVLIAEKIEAVVEADIIDGLNSFLSRYT
ncbi:MAG: hypothetical protein H0M93_03540 [Methanophagales archaeon]|nr:hypothetical protein [Methanophagales archaeon]